MFQNQSNKEGKMKKETPFEYVENYIYSHCSNLPDELKENLKELKEQIKKWKYYEDIALHGRDSDDAKKCVQCRNDEIDFIDIDLGQYHNQIFS